MENIDKQVVGFASKAAKPLSIVSLGLLILYLLYKAILKLDIFSKLQEDLTFALINSIVDKVFLLAVAALVIGVAAYIYTHRSPTVQPADPNVEFLKRELEITTFRKSLYAQEQLKAYRAVWEALQKLENRGEALWRRASKEHLEAFTDQLDETKSVARANQIVFETEHYEQLRQIFLAFERFWIGKLDVYTLRSKKADDLIEPIQQQIERNRKYKAEYEQLVERIGEAFKKQLSAQ